MSSSGLAAKLPLVFDNIFGPYNLITDFESLATQNLKMLVLTNPGERMMDPNFGVGLRKYLFELNIDKTYTDIQTKIIEQVSRYLPYIKIQKVQVSSPEAHRSRRSKDIVNPDNYPNQIKVSIYFKVVPLNITSELEIDVNNNIN